MGERETFVLDTNARMTHTPSIQVGQVANHSNVVVKDMCLCLSFRTAIEHHHHPVVVPVHGYGSSTESCYQQQ